MGDRIRNTAAPIRAGRPIPAALVWTPSGVSPCEAGGLLQFVAVQRERDQAVQQFAEANPAVLPHLGVHADGGEARDGIDLVDVEAAGPLLQKEINTIPGF